MAVYFSDDISSFILVQALRSEGKFGITSLPSLEKCQIYWRYRFCNTFFFGGGGGGEGGGYWCIGRQLTVIYIIMYKLNKQTVIAQRLDLIFWGWIPTNS